MMWSLLFSLITAVSANDGAASLEGGELRFKKLKGVTMESEELTISPTIVRVKYRFRNTTKRTIRTTISFPVKYNLDGDLNFSASSKNPNEFSVQVNGKARTFKTKVKETKYDKTIHHYWEQSFPPGKAIFIEHRYKPIFSSGVFDMMSMQDKEHEEWVIKPLKLHFCAKESQLKKVRKRKLKYKQLYYYLKTANTWDGPIGEFKLKLEKGKHPYLFLCTDLKIRRDSSGKFFIAVKKNFSPTQDLNVAYVGP